MVTGNDFVLELAGLLRGFGLVLRRTAKLSCSSRVICHLRATFSAVLPM